MKIPQELETALNEQIKNELGAFYLYWAMACWFETTPYHGFASWMRAHGQEELSHANKIHDYLLERGSRVTLLAIDKPTSDFKSPQAVFEMALQHEQKVTNQFHSLYELALRSKDYASEGFLDWFLKEQIEEEKTIAAILEKLQLSQNAPGVLFFLDAELGKSK